MVTGQAAASAQGHRHPALALVGLVIAYSPSYINPVLRWAGADRAPQGPPSVLLWNWVAVVLLLLFVLGVERRGLESIALRRPTGKDIRWALVFWGAAAAASVLVSAAAPPSRQQGLDSILRLPLPVVAALVLMTATTEEILFRGYPIERLREWTGRTWPAVAASFALFVLPHVRFFGPSWLMYHGVGVVLLYVLYVWRRNLWACMTMHFLGNAPLLLVAAGAPG